MKTCRSGSCEGSQRACSSATSAFSILRAYLAQVGDVLFQGSIGRTDFPRSDHAALLNAITTKLWPLGDDVAFVPGHGPTSTFGAERRSNPFVSDQAMSRAPIARPATGPS